METNLDTAQSPGCREQRLVRPLLAPDCRQRVHPLCHLPKGYRLLRPFEKIVAGCKFTRAGSPKWIACNIPEGSDPRDYFPAAYHVYAVPNVMDEGRRTQDSADTTAKL